MSLQIKFHTNYIRKVILEKYVLILFIFIQINSIMNINIQTSDQDLKN